MAAFQHLLVFRCGYFTLRTNHDWVCKERKQLHFLQNAYTKTLCPINSRTWSRKRQNTKHRGEVVHTTYHNGEHIVDVCSYPSREGSDGLDHRRRLEHKRGALLPTKLCKLCKTVAWEIPVGNDYSGVGDSTGVSVDEFLAKKHRTNDGTERNGTGRYESGDSMASEYVQREGRAQVLMQVEKNNKREPTRELRCA